MTIRAAEQDEPPAGRYVLGHSEHELQRLEIQAAMIEPITRGFLLEAGLEPGMRVLDVGSGVGDVAFLAAELVGESGTVVGVERAPEAVRSAVERAAQRGLRNVEFEVGDPTELTFDVPFDALVGRYVLQFQPDPGAMLRGLVRHVRPGGVVAFHEVDWSGHRSFPPVPTWDRCCRLAVEALLAGGAETRSGSRLPATFAAAGLPAPTMRMVSVVGAGASSATAVGRLAGLFVTLLPSLEELGLVAPGEFDPATLAERLVEEATETCSVVLSSSEMAAWSRR